MKSARFPLFAVASALTFAAVLPARAQLIITEVMSQSVAAGSFGSNDWFEVTNIGNVTVSLDNFRMDDNSYAFASSVPLSGVASLAPGQSAVFTEFTATDPFNGTTTDAATQVAEFRNFWGGRLSNTSFAVGTYTGSGVGLGAGTAGDGVILFDGSQNIVAKVSFGAATTGSSFYTNSRASQASTTATPLTLISATGQPGVYTSADAAANVGSPDFSAAVPEPSTFVLAGVGLALAGVVGRRTR